MIWRYWWNDYELARLCFVIWAQNFIKANKCDFSRQARSQCFRTRRSVRENGVVVWRLLATCLFFRALLLFIIYKRLCRDDYSVTIWRLHYVMRRGSEAIYVSEFSCLRQSLQQKLILHFIMERNNVIYVYRNSFCYF